MSYTTESGWGVGNLTRLFRLRVGYLEHLGVAPSSSSIFSSAGRADKMALDEGIGPPLIASEATALPLCKSRMAGAERIELSTCGSKPHVLPLHHTPMKKGRYFYSASSKAACFEGVAEPARIIGCSSWDRTKDFEVTARHDAASLMSNENGWGCRNRTRSFWM